MRSAIASAVKPQWSWMTSKRRRWAATSIASNARATWSTSYSERSISSGWGASSSVTTVALETDPGAQNRVTSWPRRTMASVRTLTTSSTPPYPGGGTAIHGGASMAIRSGAPDAGPRVLSTVSGRRARVGASGPALRRRDRMLARPRAPAGRAAASSEVNKEQSAGDGGRSQPAVEAAVHARASATSPASRSAVETADAPTADSGGPPRRSHAARRSGSDVHATPQRQQASSWASIGAWHEWHRRGSAGCARVSVPCCHATARDGEGPAVGGLTRLEPRRAGALADADGGFLGVFERDERAGLREHRAGPDDLPAVLAAVALEHDELARASSARAIAVRVLRACFVAVAMADRLSALLTESRLGSEKS